jgi:hypothetical protein
MKTIILPLVLMSLLACSFEPLHPIQQPAPPHIPIDSNNQPEWVLDIAEAAVQVWREHDVPVALDTEGNTVIHSGIPDNYIGYGYLDDEDKWHLYVSNNQDYNITCIVARHIGYGLKLGSGTTGLMLASAIKDPNAECPWSQEDEQRICRVLNICH